MKKLVVLVLLAALAGCSGSRVVPQTEQQLYPQSVGMAKSLSAQQKAAIASQLVDPKLPTNDQVIVRGLIAAMPESTIRSLAAGTYQNYEMAFIDGKTNQITVQQARSQEQHGYQSRHNEPVTGRSISIRSKSGYY